MSGDDRQLNPASEGTGVLLQRDYWAVLDSPRIPLHAIGRAVAEHFERFAPPDIVRFARDGGAGLLEPGDEMEVRIPLAGSFRVRVVHRDSLSLTIATVRGHPEAGRITFGVYPNPEGDLVFHIRSRARSGSRRFAMGFAAAGEPMQTNTWTGFIDRIAATVADGVRDVIHVETREVDETDADRAIDGIEPTFQAVDPERGEA